MVRRSFRIGLRLGLLFGATLALVKTVQSRRASSHSTPTPATPAPWEPISEQPPVRPAAVVTDLPRDEPLDEVGEPILEFEAEAEPAAAMATPAAIPTPPESELLNAGVESSAAIEQTDPSLDIVTGTEPKKAPPRPALAARRAARVETPPTAKKAAPEKAAPAKRATKKAAAVAPPPQPAWVEADGGVCPPTHPVKAKLASRLFHLPGMFAYDRTRPDRCYSDSPTAVADGFTSAKR